MKNINTCSLFTLLFYLLFIVTAYAGNSPCTATPIPNNMTAFQVFSNLGNTDSGVPDPGCGNYAGADFWFSTTVPASGLLDIATIAGGMTDGAMAIYDGSCANPNLISCTDDDNCGNTIMPVFNLSGLSPGTIIFIRVWAEGGGPNGTFEIRVSNGPIGPPPIPTTATVGNAQYTAANCVQLTNSTISQMGCAWDPVQINLNLPFDQTFNFNFGNDDAGADGICWVFQNNPAGLNTCGGGGMEIGANFTNSFIIEFDTWDNGIAFGDIFNDHVAVNINGNMGAPINGPIDLGNIEDGQDHEIRLTWNPATNLYQVFFDGALSISGNYDIINNALGGNPNCFWGFTSSTGGAFNEHTVCPVPVPEFPAGEEMTVDVEICEGESYFAGGANQTTSGLYVDITPLANGCSSILNTNLTVHPVATFAYDAVICNGDPCEMVGFQTFCETGIYEVTLTNQAANGCDSIVTLNLTVLDPIAVAFPPAPITCFNNSVLIDASPSTSWPGTVSYSWTGPTPNCILSGQNTVNPVVNCPGTYTMTLIQILNGTVCEAITSVEVIDGAILPNVEAGDNQNLDCDTDCVMLSSVGSDTGIEITLTWTGPNNFSTNDPHPQVCEAGVYTLSILNTATGCLASDFVTVGGNPDPPDIAATISGILSCENESVILDAGNSSGAGNLSYEWLDEDDNVIAQTEQIEVMDMGTYTLIITDDANGCTADSTINVEANLDTPNAVAMLNDTLDCENNSVSIDASMSSGSGTLSYEWQNTMGDSLGDMETYDAVSAGIYILIITDSENGCTASTSVEVFENTELPVVDAMVSGELTCENQNVELDAGASSAQGAIEYEWQNSNGDVLGTAELIEVNSPGIYTIIITDTDNACTASTTIEVEENTTAPTAEANVDELLTCTNEMVTLDGSNSSGTGTLDYEWLDMNGNSIATTSSVQVSNTEVYTLVITDQNNGCTAETMINADEDITDPIADAGDDAFITCTDTDATLDGSASSSGNNFSYEWINEGNVIVGTELTVDVSEAGTYTLIVTNTENGCTASSTAVVEPDSNLPTANAGNAGVLTCTIDQVTLDGSASSSGANITYEWLDPNAVSLGNDLMIDVNQTGTYTLIVTDTDNGCTATASVEVSENTIAPVADAENTAFLTCSETTVSLSAAASSGVDLAYEWQNTNGEILGMNETITVSEVAQYTLIVTDQSNGCTASTMVEVQADNDTPESDAGMDELITCIESVFTLEGSSTTSGNLSYEWLDEQGNVLSTIQTLEVSNIGLYTFVVTNEDNGCTASDVLEVTEDTAAPNANAGANAVLDCNNTTVSLDGSSDSGGMLDYEWQDESGMTISSTQTVEVNTSGTYTLLVTNLNNGCTGTSPVIVDENFAAPVADPGVADMLTCTTTTITLDAENSQGNGTLTYQWLDANAVLLGTMVTQEINTPGDYTLIVTDASNGCTHSGEIEVEENIALPTADAGQGAFLTCNDTEVMLSGSGSSQNGTVSYEWQNAGGIILGTDSEVLVSETGTYTLIVTDDLNGCTTASTVEVLPDANLPTADAGSGASLTCNETTVLLDGSNSSTGTNIIYEWQDASGNILGNVISQSVSDPGVYVLIVTDTDNGCTATSSVEVLENTTVPNAVAGMNALLTCEDSEALLDGGMSTMDNGSITAFTWLDENDNLIADEQTVLITAPGTYTLIVTGSNGCTASDDVLVTQDANVPVAIVGTGGILTCDNTTIDLGDANSNMGLNVTYQWTNSDGDIIANTAEVEINLPDVYTLEVVNLDNNCISTADIEILENVVSPVADAGTSTTLTCLLTEYELGGLNTSIGSDFSYQWQNSVGSLIGSEATVDISEPDTYTFTVTNLINGCTESASVIIDQDIQDPIADAGPDGILTCDVTEIMLDGSNSSGTDLSYEWQNEAGVIIGNEATLEVSETGNFTLLVTNMTNGCTAESMTTVSPDANLPTAIAVTSGILNCINNEVTLDAGNSSSTSGSIAFEWLDELGNSVSTNENVQIDLSGIYTLIVTDVANACSAATTIEVLEDVESPSADAGPQQTLVCGQTEVTLFGTGANGTNLIYEWQDGQGNIIATTAEVIVNSSGTYSLIVTNTDNGCTASSSVEVVPDMNLPTALASVSGILTCIEDMVTLDAAASSQGNNIAYQWLDENGNLLSTSIDFDTDTPGSYTLVVLNTDNNCSATDEIIVDENVDTPTAFADFGAAQSLDCNNTSIVLDGSGSSPFGGLDFMWETSDGNIVSGANTVNPEIDEPGTYILTVINTLNGCTDSEQIFVDENIVLPGIIINEPDLLTCTNIEVLIDASLSSSNGDFTYNWSGSGIISGANTLQPVVNQSGIFTLTIIDNSNGCENTSSIPVNEDTEAPQAVAIAEGEFDCLTESVSLDGSASSIGVEFSYSWTGAGNISDPNLLNPVVDAPGAYTLIVTDVSNGCTQSVDVLVEEDTNVPTALDLAVEEPLCFGDNASIAVLNVAGGTPPYLYSLDGGDSFVGQNFFTNLDPGNYDLLIQDAKGCELAENIIIETPVEVDVALGADVLIQLGENYQLNALTNIPMTEIDTIIWTPTIGLSCTNCLNPELDSINQESLYTVTVINTNGCRDSDQIIVRVQKDRSVYIPNIFTPNDDGINDLFMIQAGGDQISEITEFQIFDRWGEVVFTANNFQPNDPSFGWDGQLRGQELNPGVFVYWVRVEFIDGFSMIFKGDITLAR